MSVRSFFRRRNHGGHAGGSYDRYDPWPPEWDQSTEILQRTAQALRAIPAEQGPLTRPMPPASPPGPRLPVPQAVAMLPVVRYPAYDGNGEAYAAVMRHVSRITGTSSPLDSPGEWPRRAIEAPPPDIRVAELTTEQMTAVMGAIR